MYVNISQEEAYRIMCSGEEHIILDVRTKEEYDKWRIKNAILLPLDELEEKAEKILTDKNIPLLVYCRSGYRSKIASQILENKGYKDVREFGGIINWRYEIDK